MMKNKFGWTLLLSLFSLLGYAQQTSSVRINEVLVVNEENFQDDYGNQSAWIELFNNSAGTVNLRGCYLTNDKNNPTKYMIPKGDVLTSIPPRQHTLFWADGEATKGTFHVNFKLDPSKENYIALYDADGTTLIDEVVVPAAQKADVSFGLDVDGTGTWATLSKVTPSTNNVTLDSNAKIENFQNSDPSGIGMTITAMAVVFIALLVLFLIFEQIGKAAIKASERNARIAAKAAGKRAADGDGQVPGDVIAAISMALYEISDSHHDIENTVLTINKVKRNYSPWSSKIYGMRELPKK